MNRLTNKAIILIIMILAAVSTATAQPKASKLDREEWNRQMREFKHDFFARELDLTDAQKTRFFALYDAMESERHAVRRAARKAEKALEQKGKSATDEEYERVAAQLYELKGQENSIEMKYYAQYKDVLNKKQLVKLKDVERKFGKLVRDQYREYKKKGGQGEGHHKK